MKFIKCTSRDYNKPVYINPGYITAVTEIKEMNKFVTVVYEISDPDSYWTVNESVDEIMSMIEAIEDDDTEDY